MLFSCVEKQGKYRDLWTLRRIAFDTETGMLYCTARETDLRVMWKHQVRVVRIIARPSVVDIDYKAVNFDVRELFSFKVEGASATLTPRCSRAWSSPRKSTPLFVPFRSVPTLLGRVW
ncbi:hypothetical protein TcBrA4_0041870 [Trypanosoma cruzi]|nr:hypothetical protein TcBrA4_0041870 [Trypanosoma cruzi]